MILLAATLLWFSAANRAADAPPPPVPATVPSAPTHVPTNGSPASPAFEFSERIRAHASEAGDREVAAAAEYNLVHLRALAADEAVARPALEQLAKSGDAFTLQWLDAPGYLKIPAARQPQISATQERIRERLKGASPPPSEKQVEAWLLRAAVSDLTCNALEVPLGRFRTEWMTQHRDGPAVRSQLETLAASPRPATVPVFGPGFVRDRALSYCLAALNPPPAPANRD